MNSSKNDTLQKLLKEQLHAGEEVVWQGRPISGLRVSAVDGVLSVAAGVFLWRVLHLPGANVFTQGIGAFTFFQVPLLAVGIYLCLGRYVYDAARRGQTLYCLTRQRALIIENLTLLNVKSVELSTVPEIRCFSDSTGSGMLVFGPHRIALRGFPVSPRFEALSNVPQVCETARQLAYDARRALAEKQLRNSG